ncbi:hypothetical protein BDP27DRAFT_1428353 [Rhodocollybia butyracea]|uniref:Uncharacterized protein n=1 Tax=Rhodocollybia butyracea TaxID=206335 RepID=A0A9P5PH62_9AGAR|nr:hypothetical protein BDP27DRAFT_1428353 [Rhodocollybia butyracea]
MREVFITAIDLLGPLSASDRRRPGVETNEAEAKLKLCKEMNEVAARMGSSFSVDLTDLSQASSVWNGRMYTRLPDSIQMQVLQEIFKISFKQEFLLLDRYLYKLVPRREEGEIKDEFEACT